MRTSFRRAGGQIAVKYILIMTYKDINHDSLFLRMVRTLVANGYSVMVIGRAGQTRTSLRKDTSNHIEMPCQSIPIYSVHLLTQKIPNIKFLSWLVRYLEFVLRSLPLAIKFHPDIIHCINVEALPLAFFCSRLANARLVYEARELFFATLGAPFLFKFIERLFVHRASAVICPNEARANVYTKKYNLHDAPHVILNVPVSTEFDIKLTASLKTYLTHKLSNIEHKKILLYGGLIGPERGLENAIKEARQFDENIVLALIGAGSKGWILHLEQLIKEHNLEQKVVILPPVSRATMLEFMVSADAGLVSYDNTSLNNYLCAPTKMWELLHLGTPIIGCDLPEIANLLHKHRVGLLFSYDIQGNLAVAVNTLLTNDQLHDALSSKAKEIAHNYCWEIESSKFVMIYSELKH